MKGKFKILLMVACLLPLFSLAKEETMVERRQRIMRKYLRGEVNVTQSDLALAVEVARPEDEELTSSEQFKTVQVNLQRTEVGGTVLPPPPAPRRRLPSTKERNWLLAADPTLGDSLSSSNGETPKKPADWTLWGQDQDRGKSLYGETSNKGWFGRKEDLSSGTSGQGSRRQKDFYNSSKIKPFSFGNNSSMFQQKEAVPAGGYSGIFGRKQEQQPSASSLGTLDLSRDPLYNPNLDQGRLKSPFQRESAPSTERSIGFGSKTKSYTPYKSPYETQRQQQQQQQQQWGGQGQQQEYKRVDPRQKWKKRTPSRYDPTAGDAYVNELMPKRR